MKVTNGIVAEKGGRKRSFSKIAWDYLPNHKNGWKIVPSECTEQPKDYPPAKEVKEETKKFFPDEALQINLTSDYKVKDLPELFKSVNDVETINKMIEGDKRKSAVTFAELRIEEINKG